MTLIDDINSAALPDHTVSFTPNEVKQSLVSGTVGALLECLLPEQEPLSSRAGVRLIQEKHRRDSTTLMLQVEGSGPHSTADRILVLHFPRQGLAAEPGPRAWWYPADPYLPALQGIPDTKGLLRQRDWTTPRGLEWFGDGDYRPHRLGYKPGQRASFVLVAPTRSLVLKIVHPRGYADLLARALAIDASVLSHQLALPRLLGTSSRHHAFLYEFLPGRGLDTLTGAELAAVNPFLAGEFVRLAGMIHSVRLPGVPVWSAAAELSKSRPLVEQVGRHCPDAADRLHSIFDRLGVLFAGARVSGQLIHNDFTARNLLLDRDPGGPGSSPRLTVIDWDSAVSGPAERDVAAFLSSRLLTHDAAGTLPARYDAARGGRLDRDLLNGFLAHQRLLKAARRYLTAGDQARLVDALALIADRLERNPLAG